MAESTTTPRRGTDVQTAAVTETEDVKTATAETTTSTAAAVVDIDDDDVNWREVEGIRYTGTADYKQYSAEDLKILGFDAAEEGVEWTPTIRELPKKHFNAASLRAIVAQSDFEAI